jgi:LuxR family maltose regulon positive regulatory protein
MSSTPLLATKLILPPPGRNRVERPRLVYRLDDCLQPGCRLALLSAPAGFGKTTLVSAWISSIKSREVQPAPLVAWLSLDHGDNDPVIFWSYLISALQTRREGLGNRSLSLLQSTQALDLEGSLAPLVNELNGIPNPFILILDDYHVIRNLAVHHSLAFFLEHVPLQFHLVVATRTDPPLQLALLRGRGQLVDLRLNDLRFSDEDAAAFLNSGMGLDLAEGAVRTLNQKAEGWAAGLQMAALSLREAGSFQNRERVDDFIAAFSGSNRYILDYLIEEVLDRQPPEIQNFLLKTSILELLCAPLCDAMIENREWRNASSQPLSAPHSPFSSSQSILEYLEQTNLFLVPLDDERSWYRYHQLFAELLQKRLSQVDPKSLPELHQRAIQWYEGNGLIPQAVDHAFRKVDYPKAASLVSRVSEELWGRGEHVTLLGWIDALPEEEKRNYPHLWVWQVSMLISAGKLQEAERCIPAIERYIGSASGDDSKGLLLAGKLYALRVYIASFYKDIPGVFKDARLALEKLDVESGAGDRCGVCLVLSNAYLTVGDFEAASQTLLEAIQAGKTAQRPYMVLTAVANLAIVFCLQGDLKRASPVCQEGLLLVRQNGLERAPMASELFIAWGFILCERRELDEAEENIRQGISLARERNYIWPLAWGYLALIRLLLARGDLAAAGEALREAGELADLHEIPVFYTGGISGLRVRVWIGLGELERARRYLQNRNICGDFDTFSPNQAEFLALARLYLVQGELEASANLLDKILSRSESIHQTGWIIQALVLQALVYQAQGDLGRSLGSLERALELAELHGYLQTFVDESGPMARLLSEAVRRNIHPDYAARLLEAFPVPRGERASGADIRPDKPALKPDAVGSGKGPGTRPDEDELVEPLTKREMEVLRLIAEGCSNKEIAQKLSISLRTVKFYATNIYSKLGASGRTQAAYKARELGLL